MGPVSFGGLGTASAAVLVTVAVAIAVVAIVWIGGGVQRPLFAPAPHVAAAHATPSQG